MDNTDNSRPVPYYDAPQPAPRPKRPPTWLWITLATLLVVLLTLAVTNPGRLKHREAVVGVLQEWVDEKLDKTDIFGDFGFWAKIGVNYLVDKAIDETLEVKDYVFFSVGYLDVPGATPARTSVGVLGHVFTYSKASIDEAFRRLIREFGRKAGAALAGGFGHRDAPVLDDEPDLLDPMDGLGADAPLDEIEPMKLPEDVDGLDSPGGIEGLSEFDNELGF